MNGNPELKEGFTQIQNETLEVFIKGFLNETEMKIAIYIIRESTGYHRDWTNETTIRKIANEIGISRSFCSRTVNQMARDNKIARDNNRLKFNANYKEWIVLTNRNAPIVLTNRNAPIVLTNRNAQIVLSNRNAECEVIVTPVLTNRNAPSPNNQEQTNAPNTPKYTLNILNKEERIIKERKITFNNQTFKFENIPKEKIDKWIEAYPNCNVQLEMKKMEAWLAANPERRKKNYEKFIVNWLGRAKGEKANERYIGITGDKVFTGANNAKAGEW